MNGCIESDKSILDEIRAEIGTLKNNTHRIHARTTSSLSIVGTDGGNNSLFFDPLSVHIIRVVDSDNRQYYMDVITPSSSVSELSNRVKQGGEHYDALKDLMNYFKVDKITDITPMIKEPHKGESQNDSWIQVYREIVEWATLFSLVRKGSVSSDTLFIFDGFLRSKIFRGDLFKKIKEGIEEGIERQRKENNKRIYLVGLAKRSKVLERYQFAMHLDGIMEKNYPCYVEVPRDLEIKSYKWAEYARDEDLEGKEVNKFVAGKMFLVKFGKEKFDPIWPVDIFLSQKNDAQQILGSLLNDAEMGFPVPFYPLSLQRAHDNAALAGFDIEIIQSEMLKSIEKVLGSDSDKVYSFFLRNKNVAAARYDKG